MRKNETRRFTVAELKEYDGKDGRPAYSAFRGKVFDVSNSPFWKKGKHTGVHSAGFDLTESMINAPHSETVFSKFQIVGELVLEESTRKKGVQRLQEFFYDFRHIHEESSRKKVVQRLKKLYLHPMFVHFSMAVPILAFLSAWVSILPPNIPLVQDIMNIFGLNNQVALEIVSYSLLVLGFLAAWAGFISGIFSWKVTYEGRMTKMFARKIYLSIILIAIILVCLVWRTFFDPNVLKLETVFRYIYLALESSFVIIIVILGHYGGKIVYS